MGNRGCLHGPDRRLGTTRWRSKAWICCTLDWKGLRRDPMTPGRWTALFFLDEATALASGHRPCAYCRRADFNAFAEAWQRAHGSSAPPRAGDIDARLHAERLVSRTRRQQTRPAPLGGIPDGAMVRHRGPPGLVMGAQILPWSFAGYGAAIAVHPSTSVELLTPPATVSTLAEGFRPLLHPSAAPSGFAGGG
jgi:hypothetical protein